MFGNGTNQTSTTLKNYADVQKVLKSYSVYHAAQIVNLSIRQTKQGWRITIKLGEPNGRSQGSVDGIKRGSNKVPNVLRKNQQKRFKINRFDDD